jgi:hypothetical protein
VGSARLTQKDVTALVESQQRLATLVKGMYFLANTAIYLRLGRSVVEPKIFLEALVILEKFGQNSTADLNGRLHFYSAPFELYGRRLGQL